MKPTDTKPTDTKRRNILVAAVATIALFSAACGETAAATDDSTPAVASLPADDGNQSSVEATDDSDDTDDSADQDSTDDAPELTPEEAQVAFSQCLENEGVDDPFGGADGELLDGDGGSQTARFEVGNEEEAAAFDAALEKCNQIYEDNFGEFEMSPEQEAEARDLEAAFNQCMSDEGFTSANGGFEIEDGSIEDFEAAIDGCESIYDDSDLFGQEN